MTAAVTIRIQEADFDIAREIAALTYARTDIGAVVSFSGICRDSEGGDAIAALTLEHYPGMAEAEIARHAATAMSRWPRNAAISEVASSGNEVPTATTVRPITRSEKPRSVATATAAPSPRPRNAPR